TPTRSSEDKLGGRNGRHTSTTPSHSSIRTVPYSERRSPRRGKWAFRQAVLVGACHRWQGQDHKQNRGYVTTGRSFCGDDHLGDANDWMSSAYLGCSSIRVHELTSSGCRPNPNPRSAVSKSHDVRDVGTGTNRAVSDKGLQARLGEVFRPKPTLRHQ